MEGDYVFSTRPQRGKGKMASVIWRTENNGGFGGNKFISYHGDLFLGMVCAGMIFHFFD